MTEEAEYLLSILREQSQQLTALAGAVLLMQQEIQRQKCRLQLLEASEALTEMNEGRVGH
jgi:hypothetical protein